MDQQKLRDLIFYDPESGLFSWAKDIGRKIKAGTLAGSASGGYLYIQISGKNYRAHRLAWLYVYGSWPDDLLDHRDGNGLNNRISNLRQATYQENNYNKTVYKNNTSGIRGVTWNKEHDAWKARIKADGKEVHIGYFVTIEEAEIAVNAARLTLHGEFYTER